MRTSHWIAIAIACAGCGLQTFAPDGDADGGSQETTTFGNLGLDPGSIAFGRVEVGDFVENDIVLSNGGQDAIRLTAALLDGDDSYSLTTTLDLPLELQPGQHEILTVAFAPIEVDSFSATLDISVAGLDGRAEVELSGSGVFGGGDSGGTGDGGSADPGITISDSAIDFGTVDLGDRVTTDVTVTVTGPDDVLIADIVPSDSVFETSGEIRPPQVLSSGSTRTLTISYQPTVEVTSFGTITLETDLASAQYLEIDVTGTCNDACDVCAPILSVDTGGDSAYTMDGFISLYGLTDWRELRLQNVGDIDLTVSRLKVNNDILATCGSFTLSSSAGAVLGPYDTMVIDVGYTATDTCLEVGSAALDSNVIHIYSDDPSESDHVIELGAVGL